MQSLCQRQWQNLGKNNGPVSLAAHSGVVVSILTWMPLQPLQVEGPSEQISMDLIGPFHQSQHGYQCAEHSKPIVAPTHWHPAGQQHQRHSLIQGWKCHFWWQTCLLWQGALPDAALHIYRGLETTLGVNQLVVSLETTELRQTKHVSKIK